MRDRILGCSMELFGCYGIKGLTMDALAAELGISKRTLYEYFTRKEDLLGACLQSRLDEQRLFDPTDGGLIDELLALYGGMQRIDLKKAHRFCRELQKFYHPLCKTLLDRLSGYAAVCGKLVGPGITAGYIRREVSPEMVRTAVTGCLMQLFACVSSDYADIRNVLSPETIVIFTRGLCTIKGRTYLDQKLKASA